MEKSQILIVEDEWIVAEDIQVSLQEMGYEVCGVVASGEESIEYAKNKKPDLIIMDIVLQGEINGVEAARIIKSQFDIPIIYLTAYSDKKLLEEAKKTEPFGYLIKPFKDRDLHSTIEMALYKHKTEIDLKDKLVKETSRRTSLEDAIEASLKERNILIEEVHHRVRNNMQVIYELLDFHSLNLEGDKYENILKGCQNRIMSIALAHSQLYKADDLTAIDFDTYIQNLTEKLWHSHNVDKKKISLNFNIAPMPLSIDKAIPCGLIINELVSNSLKHAFPGDLKGQIWVSLIVSENDEYEIIVKDNGIGLPKEFNLDNAETFGFKMLSAFGRGELKGKVEINRDQGTEFRIKFDSRP